MKNKTEFKHWNADDKIKIAVLLPALVVLLIMTGMNVFANLTASNPVFIENPTLALFLSALAPMGSLTLKFVSQNFDSHKSKKNYAVSIYVATAIVFFCWLIAFSLQFSGAAGDVIWGDDFGESSGKGSLLVFLQLLSEILVAASLALAAEQVYIRYNSLIPRKNPFYIEIQKSLDKHTAKWKVILEERADIHAQLVKFRAERQIFINSYLSEYAALRARRAAANNF